MEFLLLRGELISVNKLFTVRIDNNKHIIENSVIFDNSTVRKFSTGFSGHQTEAFGLFAVLRKTHLNDPVTGDIKTDQEMPNWEEEDELLLWKCIALHKPESAALLTDSKNQFTNILLSNSKTECADLTQLTFRSSLTSRRFPIMGKGGLRRLQNGKLFTKSKATMRKATTAEAGNNKLVGIEK
ncbi:hypothetical protein T12_4110 [Trichinella patagoniensis]|uniref:Uncharacterized protein n=1 Tax=Trichinella patagoniensis TaxID=990121 RepID=A0A0V0ZLB8_9BILA|nr:hypothetical protein T12_4110 [Trichinella patagoniensis]